MLRANRARVFCEQPKGSRLVAVSSTFENYAERLEACRLTLLDASGSGASEPGTSRESLEAAAALITELDKAVGEVEGHGFEATPFLQAPDLAAAAGVGDCELWVKDETGNVSGSHKGRHLFGAALSQRLQHQSQDRGGDEGTGDADDAASASSAGEASGRHVIASCGNAALAAAVVARAAGLQLEVFVPSWANDAVVERITELGAKVVRCERRPGVAGDPAHHAMVAAVKAGAAAFSCQGTETPAAIYGARTLAWEIVDSLIRHDGAAPARIDRLFVQVGGGALATAVVAGLADAVGRGELAAMPVVHAVQPEGNHPLVRAWDTLALEALTPERAVNTRDQSYFLDRIVRAQAAPEGAMNNQRRAGVAASLGKLHDDRLAELRQQMLRDPERYMRVWESEPVSYASGILDDITYDWIEIVSAMLASGGWPLVASEHDLRTAHRLAQLHTGIEVCPTGASGLGGLLALKTAGEAAGASAGIVPGERVAVLFTGRMRPGDPDPLASVSD